MSCNPPPTLITNVCPTCGYRTTAVSEPEAILKGRISPMPKVGDVSLCVKCAEWAVFDADLRLRTPTDEELISIGLNPGCRSARTAVVRMHAEERRRAGRR